jgi:capsid protein
MKRILSTFVSFVRRIVARYDGATFSPGRSWVHGSYQSARFDADAHSRSEMARKMRAFERNNPMVQALAGKFENFVVGANPQLSPNSSDAEWNRRAKEWWDQWCQYCDLTSRQGFGTILALIARRWFIEGDVFIVLTTGSDARGKRPRIQLIESHLCRTPKEYARDPMVHDGVRMDEYGRPTHYYFGEEVKRGEYQFGAPVEADNVIAVFEPERPGEVRGITFFHSCINEIHGIDDLSNLEMQAAMENASTTQWIETATGEVNPDVARARRWDSTEQSGDGTAVDISRTEYYNEITGGRARVLKIGDKVNQNPGQRPSVTTVEYWKLKRELVCAAVEIPYCIVFPDSMQGTVYRGALDMATAAFKSRHSVIADVERRIWEYVMGWAIRHERQLADPPPDWRNVSILPPRAPNVDVGRNAAAESEALKDGRTNFDLIYGPLGLSWQVELKKLDAQLAFVEKECPALARHFAAQQKSPQAEDHQYQIPIKKKEAV